MKRAFGILQEQRLFQPRLIRPIVLLPLFVVVSAAQTRIDQICGDQCVALLADGNEVKFVDGRQGRVVVLGKVAAQSRHLVPEREISISDVRSFNNWRIVTSVFLDPADEYPFSRLRFYSPAGILAYTEQTTLFRDAGAGRYFRGSDDIFFVASEEEHEYNAEVSLWFLPQTGRPKILLNVRGRIGRFLPVASGRQGVTVYRQTYDGEHAETKGTQEETYVWNPISKTLSLLPKRSGSPGPFVRK